MIFNMSNKHIQTLTHKINDAYIEREDEFKYTRLYVLLVYFIG